MLIPILRDIRQYYLLKRFQKKWRALNRHNFTHANTIFPQNLVSVGNGTYGNLNIRHFGSKNEGLLIGSYCSIADNVFFIFGGEHKYESLTTYPFRKMYFDRKCVEAVSKGKITIDDDVWIGFGSIVLSGVTIGRGSIIGAGSIVPHDIPPYSIYAGNRVVRYRFSLELVEILKQSDLAGQLPPPSAQLLELVEADISLFTREQLEKHLSKLKNAR